MTNTLGGRITELRKKKGVTQDQLAEHMGVSSQAVSKWENDLSCPDITFLPQLADYLHVTIDQLLRGEQNIPAQLVPEEERKDLNKILLKVNVNSSKGDIVNINLPMSLVKIGLEIGMQVPEIANNEVLKNIDFNAILAVAEKGVIGKIVDVSTAEGDVVEIVIE